MKLKLATLIWLLTYLAVMSAVTGGLLRARREAIATYGSLDAKSDWTQWRTDVENSQDPGPVKRRVPKSDAPPALVLMRDHFGVCLALSLVLSSILFGTFMVFIRGALATRPK